MRRILKGALWGAGILLAAIQLVPFGRSHSNPPVGQEPAWDSAETRALAKRACFDCHSNETIWPWYSNLAPVSWLTQRDVNEGRRKMNFSEWNLAYKKAKDAPEDVRSGEMPPWFYLPPHPAARLTSLEKAVLIKGLQATLRTPESERSEHAEGEHRER